MFSHLFSGCALRLPADACLLDPSRPATPTASLTLPPSLALLTRSGKASEGIDFPDRAGRGVVLTGIPYAPKTDAKASWEGQGQG